MLDEAVRASGRNVTGVPDDAANLDDLDRPFETLKQAKGSIDVLFASAEMGGDAEARRDDREKLRCNLRSEHAGHALHGPEGAAAV